MMDELWYGAAVASFEAAKSLTWAFGDWDADGDSVWRMTAAFRLASDDFRGIRPTLWPVIAGAFGLVRPSNAP